MRRQLMLMMLSLKRCKKEKAAPMAMGRSMAITISTVGFPVLRALTNPMCREETKGRDEKHTQHKVKRSYIETKNCQDSIENSFRCIGNVPMVWIPPMDPPNMSDMMNNGMN